MFLQYLLEQFNLVIIEILKKKTCWALVQHLLNIVISHNIAPFSRNAKNVFLLINMWRIKIAYVTLTCS